ncbi:GMC family oxidoreductase [Thalassotalea aquiviva]|uniref:GMC family oxidoreductase n=1 Tax=Thalassotalea aquiviva TaxID=3242415 RepID=UPI00352AB4AB
MAKNKGIQVFDYIIVGGGSAGGVLAYRLSEDPKNTVCLIEAGSSEKSLMISMPGAFGSHMFWHKYNWAYNSQPGSATDQRGHFCPRGKGLGGSSSINGMIYTRGHSSDYDTWAKQGNPGWDYKSLLAYFKKSENNGRGESVFHGCDGPLFVEDKKNPSYLVERLFKQATLEAGYPHNIDFNDNQLDGFGSYQLTIHKGQRAGVGKCFIEPAMHRDNVTVINNALVTKLVLHNKKVIGVCYKQNGKEQQVNAAKEVIVSAGTFNSPQLLMLSGIGCKHHLTELGLNVVHHLPGVGCNLQEHPDIQVVYENLKQDGFSLSAVGKRLTEVVQYTLSKTGPMATSIAAVGGYFKSSPDVALADIQLHFLPILFADHGRNIEYLMAHGFSCHLNVARPKSRGRVRLRSHNPESPPLIELNLLSDEDDIDRLVKAIKITRKIIDMPALAQHKGKEVFPGTECQTDTQLKQAIRERVSHIYHPVGTCKMGQDQMAVVDHELKVHGIDNLRVVDASIMPTLVSANTNAPTIMIAEKAADMILNP